MRLYNTLSRKVEELDTPAGSTVSLYTCGPTVYDYTHIGHMRKYAMDDLLKRTINYLGYKVKHVMNITDVGHLASDADEGEDKLEKGAKKYGKTVWEVAQEYTEYFNRTMRELNVLEPDSTPKATDHIESMIKLIQELEKKGFTYTTAEAVYFNVTKFSSYGRLSGQKLEDKKTGARDDVHVDSQKKHPADFALWFKTVGRFKDHTMHWTSPWGDGFPGWHIECSAMSMEYLGKTIDIHTGGIDHIPVHHENEIAQSEAATGQQFVKFWVHQAFLTVEGEKMSKSKENFLTIDDIKKHNIDPVSLRLLFMQTHYRQEMNFTWEAAKGANEAYKKLIDIRNNLEKLKISDELSVEQKELADPFQRSFTDSLANDLQTPQALATMWEMLKSNLDADTKLYLLYQFDKVIGLNLADIKEEVIPLEVLKLVKERELAREHKDFSQSDVLRQKIEEQGYTVEDTPQGYKIRKN